MNVAGIGKRFGATVALRGVTFAAAAGDRVAVIGPNGAGKTTLLAILAGVLAPDEGTLELPPAGWVPQRSAVYSKLTVRENLELFAGLERAPHGAVERMLELTGLGGDELTGTLSGGNRQRLNVAVGLLGSPPLLLLDEPSAALDPAQRERLWTFVGALDATVLFTSHDVAEAAQHAHRVLVLAGGELVAELAPTDDLERAIVCAGS
ncbi:MAG TPA: ABC transporter ATP-binding protein [Solirubrobacter sp.]|nr:ABC transporter ATP-binding protein [Solirubrobacter sp.]